MGSLDLIYLYPLFLMELMPEDLRQCSKNLAYLSMWDLESHRYLL